MAWWATFAWGWHVREERYFNAEFGIGYALGVAGLSAMLLMLLYSVRKHFLLNRPLGSLRSWLSVHMLLGLFGPLCILLHANFRLGSLNSTVALASMVLVAASGVVGRVLYPRIHVGLMGQRATLRDVRTRLDARRSALDGATAQAPELAAELRELEQLVLGEAGVAGLVARIERLRRRRAKLRSAGRSDEVEAFVAALGGVLRFRAYERLFALWHAVHLPLCLLLFGAAAVHVVAVHLY